MERKRLGNLNAYGDEIYQTVQLVLYNYQEIKDKLKIYRMEKKAKKETGGIRSVGSVSDPTGKEAEINLEDVEYVRIPHGIIVHYPVRWVEAMEYVFSRLEKNDMKLIRLSFWSTLRYEQILDELNLSPGAYYKRRDRILSLIAVRAAEIGAIQMK